MARIESLKGVQVKVCSLHCIDLNNNTLETLDTHFSYDEGLKEEQKFDKTVTEY